MSRRGEPLPTRVESLPPLPAGFDDTLAAGLADLRQELTPTQLQSLRDHVRLLLAWTAAINLSGIREPVAVARNHVVDSLTALPLLPPGANLRLLDLGSGGGFPGLPLAVAVPDSNVLLVDSIGKKAAFLETVVNALRLEPRVRVAAVRAETLAHDREHRGTWSVVVARAVAGLPDLVELSLPLLEVGGALVAWKRWPLDDELVHAAGALNALGGGRLELHPVEVDGLRDHVLIVARKVSATPVAFPRDPAARRHRPW